MTAVIHLAISRDVVLSANVEKHWAVRARHVKVIRDMAWVMAKHHRYPPMKRATIDVEVTWPDNRRRDASNLAPTAKAAIDGFVDAGLLLDDSDKYVEATTYRASPERRKTSGIAAYLKFTITEVPL